MLLFRTRDLVQDLCVMLAHQYILFLSHISVNSSQLFLSHVPVLPQLQNVREKCATNIGGVREGRNNKVSATSMRSAVDSFVLGPDVDNFSVNYWS